MADARHVPFILGPKSQLPQQLGTSLLADQLMTYWHVQRLRLCWLIS
jgi:hypothetical protein